MVGFQGFEFFHDPMRSIVFEWVETTELDVFFNGELFEKILLSLPSFGYIKTFQVQNGWQ